MLVFCSVATQTPETLQGRVQPFKQSGQLGPRQGIIRDERRLCRPGRGMVRHERGILKRPAVLQVGGDARRAKRMVAYLRRDLAHRARRAG